MKDRDFDFWYLIVFSSVTGFLFGLFLSAVIDNKMWKDDCIRRGFAEYNSKTGVWQWKGDGK